MKKIILSFIFIFNFCFAQVPDSSLFISDSLPLPKREAVIDSFIEGNYLFDPSVMLLEKFQFRVVNMLNSANSFYNNDLFRTDSEIRITTNNLNIFAWYRLQRRINLGLSLYTRSVRVGNYNSSVVDVLRLQHSKTSDAYLKYFAPIFKALLVQRKYRLVYQSTFFIPLHSTYEIVYKDNIVKDNNYMQWFHQLFYNRVYSKYFTLNMEINADYTVKQDVTDALVIKSSITPYFTYDFSRSFRFICFLDLNPSISGGFFSTFNLREAAGFNYNLSSKFTFSILYIYVALGKRMQAVNTVSVGANYNF
jgi:hypothetical protein